MSLKEEINAIFSKKELIIRIVLLIFSIFVLAIGIWLSVLAINNDDTTVILYFALSALACFISIFGILINLFTFYLKMNKDFLRYKFENEEAEEDEEIYDLTK